MYIHYPGNSLGLRWTIYRGLSRITEDFESATLTCFLYSKDNKFPVEATVMSAADGGSYLYIELSPELQLPDGIYGVSAIWKKNEDRSIARSMREGLFSVVNNQAEATDQGGSANIPVLKFHSSAGTFGYDGLSAYEMALLKGLTTKSETEWVQEQLDVATDQIFDAKDVAVGQAETAITAAKDVAVGQAETAVEAAKDAAVSAADAAIGESKEDALDAIAEAIEGLEVHYDIETDKGTVKDVQLKDGQGNKLMPRTNAEVVDVQFNAQTKNLSDRLKEMSFIKKLNIDEGLSTIGYISTSDKWTSSTYNVGTLFDVSDYVGMKVIVQKNAEIDNVRIAFLQNFIPTSGEYAKYAAGIGMIVQTDNEPVSYTIPHDCKYIYTMKRTNNHDMQPPYITIYDDSDPLSTAHLHTKAKGNVVYKILKSFYPKMMQKGNGFVNTKDNTYGRFTRNTNYYGIFISMADYRGKIIRVIPSTIFARVAFVTSAPSESTSTSILSANTRVLETTGTMILVVPQDCNFLYVYQYSADDGYNFTERIDILEIDYDSIISDFVKIENDKIIGDEEEMNFGSTKVARVFSHYFPNILSDDELNGLDSAEISSEGITLPVGVESKITHNKLFVFDDEKITLDVTTSDTDKILMYCANSNIGDLSTSDVESYVLFDFTEGKISIYRAGTISTSTGLGTVLQSTLFTASSGKFRLTIGRNRRNVFASVYNYSDRTEVSVTADESMFMETNYQIRPAGWMYRYPAFMTLAGTPVYKSFSGYAKTDLYMLFQGDSYTQGYAGLYKESWSYQSAKYFKNSRTCGISGCKLSDLIEQYHDCIKGKINVKVMVISIGINDMSDLTSDTLITTWASTLKSYCDELVADGITPIVNRIWPEGSASTATATKAKKMNDAIRSLGYDGADFGAVTGYPNNAEYYTQSHLSPDGNDLTFKIFINEMSMYKQD